MKFYFRYMRLRITNKHRTFEFNKKTKNKTKTFKRGVVIKHQTNERKNHHLKKKKKKLSTRIFKKKIK